MAGDWIKMRSNLWDDPRVARLCDLTDQPEATVIGALYWLWAAADQHTEDGFMTGLSLRQIDRKTGVQGIGKALCDVGWLLDEEGGVRIIRFGEHNGKSAKTRAVTAKRVANHKAANAGTVTEGEKGNDGSVTQALPDRYLEKEEEKDLKKTPQTPQGGLKRFDEFWETYPRKTGKENARKAWAKIKPDDSLVNEILNAVRSQARTDQWQRDGGQYIPHPATWLNGKRWEDEVHADAPKGDPAAFRLHPRLQGGAH